MSKIYYNGTFITMQYENEQKEREHSPEAVLVKNGMIAAVGSLIDMECLAGNGVEKVNLEGKCMMPAFIDTHGHIVLNGKMSLGADLSECVSFDEIIKNLKDYIIAHDIRKDGIVVGFGYDHNFLKERKHPNVNVLDKASTAIPIFIIHVSAHMVCVNSAALKLAGIRKETPNPAGGLIGRFSNSGEPNGYLEEAGMGLAQAKLGSRMKFNIKDIMDHMQDIYVENGITTVQDGASTAEDIAILRKMADSGALYIDVVSYPIMTGNGTKLLKENKNRVKNYQNHLKVGGYKLVLDGSPQGRTAWLCRPYEGTNDNYCGYPWMQDEQVEQYLYQAVMEGQQVLAHCNGDAASEQFLNLYEKVVEKANCRENLRPVMIHCQTVRNDQLERMAELKMIASVFVGHVWYWGDVHLKNLGEERGNHISPIRDALERNVQVTFHQDTPVTKPNMLQSIWCAINRVSKDGKVIGGEQRVTVYEALKAVTVQAAWQYFEESQKGSITPGKKADLVILDRSPLETTPMEIRNIKVLETIKDGQTIFVREDCHRKEAKDGML